MDSLKLLNWTLPKNFVHNVTQAWGEAGKDWLKSLPALLEYCQHKWQLSNFKLHADLSFNLLVFAEQTNPSETVALKLCHPQSHYKQEIECLLIYNGLGAVKLIDCDLEKAALLLQALSPGLSLKTYFPKKDQEALDITASVIKKLHVHSFGKKQTLFPTIEEWVQDLKKHKNNADFPFDLLDQAIQLSDHLINTQGPQVLLHGDLHPENILLNGSEWLAIDPKGVIGEPLYEAGAFIRNPMPDILAHTLPQLIADRITRFARLLNCDRKRLTAWTFVQASLAACWAFEDRGPVQDWIRYAEITATLL